VEGPEPKAVALTISRLLLDPALRARMGAAGRARVQEGFTWAMRAEELARILSRAV
jgi:glycosyltransferase involved in cell wall biosynthesis